MDGNNAERQSPPGEGSKKQPPPNSLAYFRNLKGFTQATLAKAVGCSTQKIEKLENRKNKLDPEWAARIGKVLGVEPQDLAYSTAPDAYPWATRAIPVVGSLGPGLRVELAEHSYERIGSIGSYPPGIAALRILPGSLPPVDAGGIWFVLFDLDNKEDISPAILNEQIDGARLIIRLFDGTTWWRRIQPGTRKHRYHLTASGTESILDVEIDWVCRIVGIQPGRALPPATQ